MHLNHNLIIENCLKFCFIHLKDHPKGLGAICKRVHEILNESDATQLLSVDIQMSFVLCLDLKVYIVLLFMIYILHVYAYVYCIAN